MTIKAKCVKALYKTQASIEELVYWYRGYYLRLSLGRQGFDSLINRKIHFRPWRLIALQKQGTAFDSLEVCVESNSIIVGKVLFLKRRKFPAVTLKLNKIIIRKKEMKTNNKIEEEEYMFPSSSG